MQFPNGVNKSNLIKLGVLGAAMYLMNNRNKSQAHPKITNQSANHSADTVDNQPAEQSNRANKPTSPFQMGKAIADKVLGRKS